ncbi:MAG TPA: hypothetical protein PLF26_13050 [Blastocatellia bacterium]|nr:hypothetical protein [Blastocatellia bacterium]
MRTLARGIGAASLVALLAVGASADNIYLKNGSVIRGTVVGFSDGEFTVLMKAGTSGSRSRATLAVEDIDHIEFDGDAASTGTANPAPVQNRPPVSTAPPVNAQRPDPVSNTSRVPASSTGPVPGQWDVIVDPKTDWTNSRVRVETGARVRITATGTVTLDPKGGTAKTVGPAGSAIPDKDKLIPGRPTGALIAVIGDDNDDFIYVGSQAEFVAERSGYLFLSINEGYLRDNSGSFRARIVVGTDVIGATDTASTRQAGGIHGGTSSPPPDPQPQYQPNTGPAPVQTTRPPTKTTPRRSDTGVPAGSTSGKLVREADVTVLPNIDWTNSNIRVQRGNVVRIRATGTVQIDGQGHTVTPEGTDTTDPRKLIPSRPTGGLVAVIGDDNDDFVYVGAQSSFVAEHDGILFLSVNETNLKDNSGSFSAHVAIEQSASVAPQPIPAASTNTDPLPAKPVPVAVDPNAPPAAPKPAAPAIGPNGGSTQLVIQAKTDWSSTGIVLKKGQKVRISASGSAKLGTTGTAVTPAGIDVADPHKLIAGKPTGALIGVIGDDNSDYIFIGSGTELTAQRDGILFLGINEGEVMDNSGFFTVTIVVEAPKKKP